MRSEGLIEKAPRYRSITVPFHVAVIAALLVISVLSIGGYLFSVTDNFVESPVRELRKWAMDMGWSPDKDGRLRNALVKLPVRYGQSLGPRPNLPTLIIDIKFKHWQILRAKRDEALEKGLLIKGSDDLVPALIRIGDKQTRVKLRLKGDGLDHIDSDKWSMRIEVRGNDHVMGMRRFSIQRPAVRSFQAEPIFMETLRHAGVLNVRYKFVNVIINGESKGIMALEEHFSKELLEHQHRREGVILRFDEGNFWDYISEGGRWQEGPYNNFRATRINGFREKKISKSPLMSAQYKTAVGLLRAFSNGSLPASEVFDVETTASYLAVLEIWGGWHSIQWNDIRFYFDPLSMKLEPIGYDANLFLRTDIDEMTLKREPIFKAMLEDPLIRDLYLKKIRTLSKEIIDGELGKRIIDMEKKLLSVLRHEYLLLEGMRLSDLKKRAKLILKLDDNEILRYPKTYPGRIRKPNLIQANLIDDQQGQYLEIANLLREPTFINSIHWRNKETDIETDVQFTGRNEMPIELPAIVTGASPEFLKLYLQPGTVPSNSEMEITASYANWPHAQTIIPESYYPITTNNYIPVDSAESQIEKHNFLKTGGNGNELLVEPGSWTVEQDIIVPTGYTLTAGPGTTLKFAPGAALISHGPLDFKGSSENPITLTDAGSGAWQGIAVLRAERESRLSHVDISNTRGVTRGSWMLTGGVTFYHSDVTIDEVSIKHHDGEDALNIVRSNFNISKMSIVDTQSDGFDADFSTGTISDSSFVDIGKTQGGGDAIDVSGSKVVVQSIKFHGIADKALSVGEESNMQATDLTMREVGIAVACKDGSHLDLDNLVVNKVLHAGLMAYTKKPEYGSASIAATNIKFNSPGPIGRVQNGSQITIDGTTLPSEPLNVDELY